MRKTLISAAVGIGLACCVYSVAGLVNTFNRASLLAELQGQNADEWLGLSEVAIADGSNRNGAVIEPVATWIVEPKRLLELRVAVSNRDVATGEPVCVGGTVTFIIEPADAAKFSRPLSRIAGVDRCDWPPGQYRSRFTWTMTDPASRVAKTVFQESEVFSVAP